MQAILVMFRSDGERRSFSVTRDMTVVGRREDCDLRIPLGEISRKHCRIVRDGDSLRLEDLGSSNGSYLNGQRVQEAILQPGDSIQIGPVVFVLQLDGYPADEDLNPISAAMVEAAGSVEEASHMGTTSTTESAVADLVEGLDPVQHSDGEMGLEAFAMDDGSALEPLPLEHEAHSIQEHSAPSADNGLLELEPLAIDEGMDFAPLDPPVQKGNGKPNSGTQRNDNGGHNLQNPSHEAEPLDLLADFGELGEHSNTDDINIDLGLDPHHHPHA